MDTNLLVLSRYYYNHTTHISLWFSRSNTVQMTKISLKIGLCAPFTVILLSTMSTHGSLFGMKIL